MQRLRPGCRVTITLLEPSLDPPQPRPRRGTIQQPCEVPGFPGHLWRLSLDEPWDIPLPASAGGGRRLAIEIIIGTPRGWSVPRFVRHFGPVIVPRQDATWTGQVPPLEGLLYLKSARIIYDGAA